MTENNISDNITFKEDSALMKLNPQIYNPDVVKAAAYILSEEATAIIDVSDDGKIIVNLNAKGSNDIKKIAERFNQELLNYSIYYSNNQRNKVLREAILKRVLLTNEVLNAVDELKREINMPQNIDDPENIMKSWEEVNQSEN